MMDVLLSCVHFVIRPFCFSFVQSILSSLRSCHENCESTRIMCRLLVYFISVVFVYSLYAKCLQKLLKRMEISEFNRSHLVEASWYAGLSGATVLGCMLKFTCDDDIGNIQSAFHTLFKGKVLVTESVMPSDLVFIFVMFCALLAHSVCLAWTKKGYNYEFFTRLCFFLFFTSTYPVRCVLLGIVCLLVLNVNVVCVDIARICCILGRKKSHQIYFMKNVAYLFFILHCIFWLIMFLYVLPVQVMWNALNMPVTPAKVPALLLLNFTLWSFFWLQIWSAPLPKFAWNWFCGQRDPLDCSLLPSCSDVLQELKLIRSRIQQMQEERIKTLGQQSHTSSQKQLNKRTVYQTVKCMMALKRRLKQNRMRRAMQETARQADEEEEAEPETEL